MIRLKSNLSKAVISRLKFVIFLKELFVSLIAIACLLTGLPKAVTNLLCPVGVFSTRSYDLLGDTGAECIPLHLILHLRGPYSLRCASQSLHRYSPEPRSMPPPACTPQIHVPC